mmetsp:Transcript_81630/g.206152  ORF Transcript_81630/g.206152 Transcript_81630/m.206152 type:complete len:212 (-) Transcript_81630:1900-2535(-)
MEKQRERKILLHNGKRRVLHKAEAACPSNAIEEVALPIGLVGAFDHAHKVASYVDDGEGKQEARRANSAIAIVLKLEDQVPCEKYCPEKHEHYVEGEEDDGAQYAWDSPVALGCRLVIVKRRTGRSLAGCDSAYRTHVDWTIGIAWEQILLDCPRLVDAIPLVRGIFTCIRRDSLHTARMHLHPLGDVVGLPVNHYPQVALLVVLPDIIQG